MVQISRISQTIPPRSRSWTMTARCRRYICPNGSPTWNRSATSTRGGTAPATLTR